MSERPHSMSCEYPEGCSCGASSWNEREAEIVRLKAELKDAQIAVIISRIQCVYCGTCMDVNSTDTLEHQFENHARSCPEHPMRVVEHERDALKAENERLLSVVDSKMQDLARANEVGVALVKERDQAREALREMLEGMDGTYDIGYVSYSKEDITRWRKALQGGEGKGE